MRHDVFYSVVKMRQVKWARAIPLKCTGGISKMVQREGGGSSLLYTFDGIGLMRSEHTCDYCNLSNSPAISLRAHLIEEVH